MKSILTPVHVEPNLQTTVSATLLREMLEKYLAHCAHVPGIHTMRFVTGTGTDVIIDTCAGLILVMTRETHEQITGEPWDDGTQRAFPQKES